MGKAKLTSTPQDMLRKLNDDRKKLAGRMRADFAGITTVSTSVGLGVSTAGSVVDIGHNLKSGGGTIMGNLGFYPKSITISGAGAISLDDASPGNVGSNSSRIIVIGVGVGDNLDTITGGVEGQMLILQSSPNTINIRHGVGNISTPDGANVAMAIHEMVILMYDSIGSFPTLKWRLVANFNQAAGGGGGLNNVVEDVTPQLGGELDAQGNNIVNATLIDFQTDADAWIWGVGTDIIYSVGATDTHNFQVGGSSQFGVDATYVHVLNNILRLRETSTSNTTMEMFADSPSPNDFDTISSIIFKGNDHLSNETIYGKIDAFINDTTNGTEDGEIIIGVTGNGYQNAAQLILNHTTLELYRQTSNTLGNGCEMVFHNDDGSMNDGQIVGQITMKSNDDAGNEHTYGQMIFTAQDVSNGTEDGGFNLKVGVGGGLYSFMQVNIGGTGTDYLVPSGDTHDFYVAGSRIIQITDQRLNMYNKELDFDTGGRIDFAPDFLLTIGTNGTAAALTANPVGYVQILVGGVQYQMPYYRKA